jgi:hypothetical protein
MDVRRVITIGAAALAMALPAPALATTQLRHFEGTVPAIALPSQQEPGGLLRLDVVFKDQHGRGKFTPRKLIAVNFEGMDFAFCSTRDGLAASSTLTGSFPAQAFFRAPSRTKGGRKPKRNSYVFHTSWTFTSFDGTIGARIYKAQGNGPVLFFSHLIVNRYDFPPPGPVNCGSGPRGAGGPQCRLSSESNPLPLCRLD